MMKIPKQEYTTEFREPAVNDIRKSDRSAGSLRS